MAPMVARSRQVTLDTRLARVCLTPATATLEHPTAVALVFDLIVRVQGYHQKSDKEMAALLSVSQSVYSRRTYNAARVQLLPSDMRRTFIRFSAEAEGLEVQVPTPQAQVKEAAKAAVVNLLTLMEAL